MSDQAGVLDLRGYLVAYQGVVQNLRVSCTACLTKLQIQQDEPVGGQRDLAVLTQKTADTATVLDPSSATPKDIEQDHCMWHMKSCFHSHDVTQLRCSLSDPSQRQIMLYALTSISALWYDPHVYV